MSQTTVSEYRDQYVEGQIHSPETAVTRTAVVEESVGIAYGKVVVKGTADNEVQNADAIFTKANFRGISGWTNVGNEKALSTGVNTVEDNEEINILETGEISVLIEDTVTAGEVVWYVHTTGGASTLHTYRGDIDTDKAAQIPAVFLDSGVTGDLVKIKLDYGAGIAKSLS